MDPMDPTDDELRAYCEAVIARAFPAEWAGEGKASPAEVEYDRKAAAVARALLARLGAGDDDTPVDTGWLESVGFVRHPVQAGAVRKAVTPPGCGHVPSWLMYSPMHASFPWRFDAGETWTPVRPLPTRGAVRALLAALSPTP